MEMWKNLGVFVVAGLAGLAIISIVTEKAVKADNPKALEERMQEPIHPTQAEIGRAIVMVANGWERWQKYPPDQDRPTNGAMDPA
jgi:hypothetical protein